MYGPDEHMIDPRNPSNWLEPEVRYESRVDGRYCGDFSDITYACACVLNCEDYMGPEISVWEIDKQYGDEACMFTASWDEELKRYVEE